MDFLTLELNGLIPASFNRVPARPATRRASLLTAALATGLGLGLTGGSLHADQLPLPNASFEGPATEFADPRIDAWSDVPKPFWFDETLGTWDQLTGVFKNTAPGSADHIANCDGAQAIFLFAVPQVAIFQDYESMDWAHPAPTHAFDAVYAVGRSYELTVGVIGGGGGMAPGVTLDLMFYYRDAGGNVVPVASTTVTNTAANFPDTTHFVDFTARVPVVKSGDAWAGRHVGVMVVSTARPELAGGYWDLDNVRLTETIVVPNASFEGPVTEFADPRIDAWVDAPKPFWFDETMGTWDQLTGVFKNTAPGSADHIVNCDGNQAIFLFAVPQVSIFQDYTTSDWTGQPTGKDFELTYEPGLAYEFTLGLIGGGGGMQPGATLDFGFYYRDDAGAIVPIATTSVTNSPTLFPDTTHFVDATVRAPAVRAGDAWAGRHFGLQVVSTVRPELAGGYWDLDNVRVRATRELVFSVKATLVGNELEVSWPSVAGYRYQVTVSEDAKTWTDEGAAQDGTGGELTQRVAQAGRARLWVRVRAARP